MQEAGASKAPCPSCVELASMEQTALGRSRVEGKSCDLVGFPSSLRSYWTTATLNVLVWMTYGVMAC